MHRLRPLRTSIRLSTDCRLRASPKRLIADPDECVTCRYALVCGSVWRIIDRDNAVLRRWDPRSRRVTTLVGCGTHSFSGDGGPATASRCSYPLCLLHE